MKSMTAGVVPSFAAFSSAFEESVSGKYKVRNDHLVGSHDFSCDELYNLVKDYSQKDIDSEEFDFAGSVLYSLGFEWVLA